MEGGPKIYGNEAVILWPLHWMPPDSFHPPPVRHVDPPKLQFTCEPDSLIPIIITKMTLCLWHNI